MNRNWEEEIDVPIGPDNSIDAGRRRSGTADALPAAPQPLRLPRAGAEGLRREGELVWTLTTNGKTEKAYATLRPDYFVDDVVMASETGALGAGTSSPEVARTSRPSVKIEEDKTRTVQGRRAADARRLGHRRRRPEAARPGARRPRRRPRGRGPAADGAGRAADANPALSPPSRITVGKSLGLHLSWFVYRGPGKATFDPPQVKAWEDTRAGANSPWAPLWAPPPLPADGKLPVTVTFDTPGTYVLRCRADDGALMAAKTSRSSSCPDLNDSPPAAERPHSICVTPGAVCPRTPATIDRQNGIRSATTFE